MYLNSTYKKLLRDIADATFNSKNSNEYLSFNREDILEIQREKLTKLLRFVKSNSKYYADKINDDFEDDVLKAFYDISPLTKKALMANWDDVVADKEITKEIVEKHLEDVKDGKLKTPIYKDKYIFSASSGSSGLRGLYVHLLDGMVADCKFVWRTMEGIDDEKYDLKKNKKVAVVASSTILHLGLILRGVVEDDTQLLVLSADMKANELCEKLNAFKPTHIRAYASAVKLLANEALKGNLSITPKRIVTGGEVLTAETKRLAKEVWGIHVLQHFGTTETLIIAAESFANEGLVLDEGKCIIETVDENLNLTDDPEKINKLLVTNLHNYTLPLIRYVIDDIVDIMPPSDDMPGCRRLRSIKGRSFNYFIYDNDIKISGYVFDILDEDRKVSEYQIYQTKHGVSINVICEHSFNKDKYINILLSILNRYGVKNPSVDINIVDFITHEQTGKVKHIIPLKINNT